MERRRGGRGDLDKGKWDGVEFYYHLYFSLPTDLFPLAPTLDVHKSIKRILGAAYRDNLL